MPIDIALLGCGDASLADALGVIASEPDVRLVGVWDSDRSLIPAAVRDYAVADAETAIHRASAVIVSAPVDERPVLCARSARAGRPALVAVPLAPSANEARRLVTELRRHRTPVLAALPLRELAALRRLRTTLRAGVAGRVSGVEAALTRTPSPAPEPSPPGHRRPVQRRHGFVELAVHLLDALALLGETPRLEAVTLDARSGGEDLGGAGIGHWGGAPLVVRASLASHEPRLRLALQGSRVSAVVSDGALELSDGAGSPDRWIGGPPDPGEPVRAFISRLRARSFGAEGLAGPARAQAIAEHAQRIA